MEAEEMDYWLRAHTALAKDWSLVPITPASRDAMTSFGLHRHLHSHAHTHTYTHTNMPNFFIF